MMARGAGVVIGMAFGSGVTWAQMKRASNRQKENALLAYVQTCSRVHGVATSRPADEGVISLSIEDAAKFSKSEHTRVDSLLDTWRKLPLHSKLLSDGPPDAKHFDHVDGLIEFIDYTFRFREAARNASQGQSYYFF